MYFTDRGIEELRTRRGEEQVSVEWLADRLQAFVDDHPEFETAIERLATYLARDDADDPDDSDDDISDISDISDIEGTGY